MPPRVGEHHEPAEAAAPARAADAARLFLLPQAWTNRVAKQSLIYLNMPTNGFGSNSRAGEKVRYRVDPAALPND